MRTLRNKGLSTNPRSLTSKCQRWDLNLCCKATYVLLTACCTFCLTCYGSGRDILLGVRQNWMNSSQAYWSCDFGKVTLTSRFFFWRMRIMHWALAFVWHASSRIGPLLLMLSSPPSTMLAKDSLFPSGTPDPVRSIQHEDIKPCSSLASKLKWHFCSV